MKTKRLIFTVDLPLKKVWSILRNVEHHLPLLPGYIRHEMVAENEFLLLIKRKNAWINKWWNLRITVKEWQEPSTLYFVGRRNEQNIFWRGVGSNNESGCAKNFGQNIFQV